ncbi:MAG TPA: crosslink repair DNA glycosylase YcaQ family protein [Jatrophihabitantaceae bacterium]|nr:crosslink repair DNA glycosylase YcaQ family protein [Jatrophihabitantaceae bacterium]
MDITRRQVLAFRVQAQGLHREAARAEELAVLDIGVQDFTSGELARLAMDARLDAPPPADVFGPDRPLALVWSLRGAPYVHRRADLDSLAGALYPLSEQDAAGRLNETGPSVARAGIPALEQYAIAIAAMRASVRAATGKGAASAAVTKRIPQAMWRDCRPCKAQHVSDSAMRTSMLAAGLELQPGTAPPVLQPRRGARLPKRTDLAALRELVLGYLRLLGPATPVEVADYFGARRADLMAAWPGELVEVRVEGGRAWLPPDAVDSLTAPADPDVVRLLGAFDPFLQARDRDLIVPDKAMQKALWPVLGRPGALFVDGEVVGTWRTRLSAKKLTVEVDAVAPLPPSTWRAIDAEAERLAQVRGAADVAVVRAG